jgi:hypothetical protein
MQNLFWPIYKQLEKEFMELSYFISIDRAQLKVYSIRIADLILRIVSECENLARELCKREKVHFKDKNGKKREIVYFNEYIDKLDDIFDLYSKSVYFKFENVRDIAFYDSLMPFHTTKMKIKGKEKAILNWYDAYNKVKHDRLKNIKVANLGNLIEGLAALFILNIYYQDRVFYSQQKNDILSIIRQIESFSDIFKVEYAILYEDDQLVWCNLKV